MRGTRSPLRQAQCITKRRHRGLVLDTRKWHTARTTGARRERKPVLLNQSLGVAEYCRPQRAAQIRCHASSPVRSGPDTPRSTQGTATRCARPFHPLLWLTDCAAARNSCSPPFGAMDGSSWNQCGQSYSRGRLQTSCLRQKPSTKVAHRVRCSLPCPAVPP